MAISAITGAEGPIRRAIQALLKTNLILMIGPEEMVNTQKSYFNDFKHSNADQAGKSEANEDPKAEQEAQTERMFKNTFRNFHDKSVEPAMFNANTIDFNYSLGEFYNRLTNPVFFYRCEIIEESWEVEPKNRDYENEVIQAEEEITETREEIRETLLTADMTNADYSIQDYIGSQDANI
ncbi:1076_t:CDS:2 [Entrophospora sp. SA101]|nr:15760_t:CDS:2 [Entrophospora sp. SA101]CAJ0761858.1 1076_t:CDS:2 [Entrophospora sp. SA101]